MNFEFHRIHHSFFVSKSTNKGYLNSWLSTYQLYYNTCPYSREILSSGNLEDTKVPLHEKVIMPKAVLVGKSVMGLLLIIPRSSSRTIYMVPSVLVLVFALGSCLGYEYLYFRRLVQRSPLRRRLREREIFFLLKQDLIKEICDRCWPLSHSLSSSKIIFSFLSRGEIYICKKNYLHYTQYNIILFFFSIVTEFRFT